MSDDGSATSRAVVAARASYSRLVAYLAAHSRDIAGAEDALADAFRAALETWPARGLPDKPEAWLLAAARRRLVDGARHMTVRHNAAAALRQLTEEAGERAAQGGGFPDERLKLLFVCAHPAISAASRTPLMLQAVLGLDAARIGSAFLVAPATMGQRLVRAKAKIRDAGIAFEVPDREELAARLDAVLEAIYAAYGTGWDDAVGADPRRRGLAEEAIWLARLVTDLLPGEAEGHGLLALMLYCEARRPARRTAEGTYVALSDQDATAWIRPMIEEANHCLARAAAQTNLGRYQLEAAIQSIHASRIDGAGINWRSVANLYNALVDIGPTIGALTGRAAAVAEADGAAAGLALLDGINPTRVAGYQPYWAVRAELLARLGEREDAGAAYTRAIGLSEDSAARAFLQGKLAALTAGNDDGR